MKQKPIQTTKQILIQYLSSEVSFPGSYYVFYIVYNKEITGKIYEAVFVSKIPQCIFNYKNEKR